MVLSLGWVLECANACILFVHAFHNAQFLFPTICLTLPYSVRVEMFGNRMFWRLPILEIANLGDCQFWRFVIPGNCQSWRLSILEIANSGDRLLLILPILEIASSGDCQFWRLPILEIATARMARVKWKYAPRGYFTVFSFVFLMWGSKS